jgi:hypothetical protein
MNAAKGRKRKAIALAQLRELPEARVQPHETAFIRDRRVDAPGSGGCQVRALRNDPTSAGVERSQHRLFKKALENLILHHDSR